MPAPGPLSTRRLPQTVRRRLEVAGATAWEALVEAHTSHALQFIALLADRVSFHDAVTRYLRAMDVREPMASAARNRVLVALEEVRKPHAGRPSLVVDAEGVGAEGTEGWKRFRPDVVMQGLKERHRRQEETERWVQLALARAEEGVISTHVDNAITFAALLDSHMTLDRAVSEYLEALGLAGARAESVRQRTMARLAEAHLPHLETRPATPADPGAAGLREDPETG